MLEGPTEAEVQPVKFTVAEPIASHVVPVRLTQACTMYVPGARSVVAQLKVAPPQPCFKYQVPSGYWTKNSYPGLAQPAAPATNLIVEPAGWLALPGVSRAEP